MNPVDYNDLIDAPAAPAPEDAPVYQDLLEVDPKQEIRDIIRETLEEMDRDARR